MSYITLRKEAGAELVEKKSRFIARACPVKTEQEALGFLEDIRAQNRTASHNVFAYRLRERNLSRYSDDGEPSGTAGMPVLDILERGDITDAIIVVTRYFGGTLLGTGGLVRAYSGSAGMAVTEAGIVTMEDLLEAIVGNIQDEYDNEDEEIVEVDDNLFTIDGTTAIEEVNELVDDVIPEGDYETLGGFIISQLGYLPKNGDMSVVEFQNLKLTVLNVEDRRIGKVRVEVFPKEAPEED